MLRGLIGRGTIVLFILAMLLSLLVISKRGTPISKTMAYPPINETAPLVPANETADSSLIIDVFAAEELKSVYYSKEEIEEKFLALFKFKQWHPIVRNLRKNTCFLNNLIYDWYTREKFMVREETIAELYITDPKRLLPLTLLWLSWEAAAVGLDPVLGVMKETFGNKRVHSKDIGRASLLVMAYDFEVSKTADEYDAPEARIEFLARAVRMVILHGQGKGLFALMYIMEAAITDFRLLRDRNINFFYARCTDFSQYSKITPKRKITRAEIANVAKYLMQKIMLERIFCRDKEPMSVECIVCMQAELRNWFGQTYEEMLLRAPRVDVACNFTLD